MKLKRSFITVLLLVSFIVPALSQVGLDKVAQSTMNFQLVGMSARGSALGNAVYASSIGAEAIFFNPAGIVEGGRTVDVDLLFTQWIADIQYKAAGVTWSMQDYGSLGFSAMIVDYGTINGTRLLPSKSQAADAYEDLGPLSNVGAYWFGLTYGKAISKEFSIGLTTRYTGQNLGQSLLSEGLKDNNAHKIVFDIGVKYYTGLKSFRFGMAFRNFSSQLMREKLNDQMPVTFTLATAMDMLDVVSPDHDAKQTSLTLGVDYLHSNNFSERMNLGLEYVMMGRVALRGGYEGNRDIQSWSAGLGVFTTIENYDLRVDYSYSAMQYFDGVNRISVGFAF